MKGKDLIKYLDDRLIYKIIYEEFRKSGKANANNYSVIESIPDKKSVASQILDIYFDTGKDLPYYVQDFLFTLNNNIESDVKYTKEEIMNIEDEELENCAKLFCLDHDDPKTRERIFDILSYAGLIIYTD